MQRKRTLAIISTDRRIKTFLFDAINQVIGHEVSVEAYSLDEGVEGPKEADRVLTSGKYILEQARLIFPHSPIIVGKRVITGYNLEKVIMLARGKKVLVANHPKECAEETIDSLMSLGITHLEYLPYWKGMGFEYDYDEIDTSISPGMTHLIPERIKNRIDIGARTLTVQTFVEILLAFELSLDYIKVFEKKYTKLLMEASQKIRGALAQSERFSKNQTIILNEIREGILSVNGRNEVIIANPGMFNLFGKASDILSNKHIREIITRLEHAQLVRDDVVDTEKTSDIIFGYLGKQLICNKNAVRVDDEKHFIYTFREAAEIQKMEQEVRKKLHPRGCVAKYTFDDIWGENGRMQAVKEKARQFARTEETILITGESGTGKELFAHAIHQGSPRKGGSFVAVNFAAIPENLVESELFGYEEGAFTGAKKGGKPGIFELAHGGTLFLDEIADSPLNIQARLLRVLEEGEIMSVGGSQMIPVDVRVIAATNKDLLECVKAAAFREDLFYRVNVLPLETPPLREFIEEMPVLLRRYLFDKFGEEKVLSPEVVAFLLRYEWPGNMRELRNVARYMNYSSRGNDCISMEDVPVYIKNQVKADVSPDHNGLNDIRIRLETQGDMAEIYSMMGAYERMPSLGRNKLVEEMNALHLFFTESKAKKYIRLMAHFGLITSGRTRQGSSLTAEGKELYAYLTRRAAASGDERPGIHDGYRFGFPQTSLGN